MHVSPEINYAHICVGVRLRLTIRNGKREIVSCAACLLQRMHACLLHTVMFELVLMCTLYVSCFVKLATLYHHVLYMSCICLIDALISALSLRVCVCTRMRFAQSVNLC